MKKLFLLLVVVFLSVMFTVQAIDYSLVDDFEDSILDETSWMVIHGCAPWGCGLNGSFSSISEENGFVNLTVYDNYPNDMGMTAGRYVYLVNKENLANTGDRYFKFTIGGYTRQTTSWLGELVYRVTFVTDDHTMEEDGYKVLVKYPCLDNGCTTGPITYYVFYNSTSNTAELHNEDYSINGTVSITDTSNGLYLAIGAFARTCTSHQPYWHLFIEDFWEGTTLPIQECGNDILETGEECDDGNLVNGDGCDKNCLIEEDEAFECSDFKDNDNDNKIDWLDQGCYTNSLYNPYDNDESGEVTHACSDGIDNDGDGFIDHLDRGCYTDCWYHPEDNDEDNSLQLTVNSPIDNYYSDTRQVLLDIKVNKEADLSYSLDGGYDVLLCRSCTSHSSNRYFTDGQHTLKVIAENNEEQAEETLAFTIDSQKPVVNVIKPVSNTYIPNPATFTARYIEDDVQSVKLFYKSEDEEFYNEIELQDCESGRNKECSVIVDLSNYQEATKIDFYFVVADRASEVQSRLTTINFDPLAPVIEIRSPSDNEVFYRRALVDLTVREKLKSLTYSIDGGLDRSLYARYDYTTNQVTYKGYIYPGEGQHTITIKAADYAENRGIAEKTIKVDY